MIDIGANLTSKSFRHDLPSVIERAVMTGRMSEHEAEKGSLVPHDHPFHEALWREDVEGRAFREQWIRDGVETFHPVRPVRG